MQVQSGVRCKAGLSAGASEEQQTGFRCRVGIGFGFRSMGEEVLGWH
jgi:hypothetical protein